MRNNPRLAAWPLAFMALLLFSTTRAVEFSASKDDTLKADCAFSNQYYSGWCRVTIPVPEGSTPRQACEAVLRCLNGDNSSCAGNINPCHAPNIRSGWRMEEAKPSVSPR